MIEYAGKYLKKTVVNMPGLWICLMQYIAYKVTVQITEQLSTRQTYSEQCQIIKMKSFAKRQAVFVKVGHFEKYFGVFLLDSFKTKFWMKNLNQIWTQPGPFFPKSGHFFDFQKWQGRPPPSPLVERLWVWLNMYQYQYLWRCFNIFENTWINCSDYTWALNMHHHLTCSTGFWRCLGF